jgi:hypothetical protein
LRSSRSGRKKVAWLRRNLTALLKVLVPVAALCLYLFPPPAPFIDRYYSRLLYPWLQSVVTPASNLAPFALFDVLVMAALLAVPFWWVTRVRSTARGRRLKALPRLLLDTVVLASGVFLVFEFMWGLNYFREPLGAKLDYDASRVDLEKIRQISDVCVTNLNEVSRTAHASPWPNDSELKQGIEPSFEEVVEELGTPKAVVPGRLKTSFLNFYLASTGIDGFTDPLAGEVILNSQLLPMERPFVLAHEWGHLAGFADESEANFIALLTCVRSSKAAVRYAGWLELYSRLRHGSGSAEGVARGSSLQAADSEVQADLQAIERRRRIHIKGWASDAQWRVYDKFLKANRVQDGVASYDRFLELLLGTRFSGDWIPVRRMQ